jgi:hypothetical protein
LNAKTSTPAEVSDEVGEKQKREFAHGGDIIIDGRDLGVGFLYTILRHLNRLLGKAPYLPPNDITYAWDGDSRNVG